MSPQNLPNSLNPELEALIDEQQEEIESGEIRLISSGIDVTQILDAQQAGGIRLPSGAWQAQTYDEIND